MKNKIIQDDLNQIKRLIKQIFGNYTIIQIDRLGGLTNHSYKVELSNKGIYVFRLPGEGTSDMINREHEKISTELACSLGIDADLIYFDNDGYKIVEYIEDAETLTAQRLREKDIVKMVANVFKTLHTCEVNTNVPFEIFEMASLYEEVINKYNVEMYDDYVDVKNKIMNIKNLVDKESVINKVPCHNDSLCENWVYGNNKLYLIDWEYAGMNDGMWDLADISIEANYDDNDDELLLTEYLGDAPTEKERRRFIANKLYLDYLWTLWGKTRVPFDGAEMEEYALNRYIRLKNNLTKYKKELF